MPRVRRFPLPWTVHEGAESFWVQDATGAKFGFTYFSDRRPDGTARGERMTREEARRIVVNFVRLPDLLRRAKARVGPK